MQGFNMGRYRPPATLDPSLGDPNSKKQSQNTKRSSQQQPASPPTVRFEMPFAIWCSTCPTYSSSQLIGQGVRFNAQKKRIGNYFSTPIWQFRMKHVACGGWIEIRTDPKNSEYVVAEGARWRDTGDDLVVAGRVGGVVIGGSAGPGEDNEKARAKEDAFAALEGRKEEKSRATGEARRLDELRSLRERDWRDADAANRKIRASFRVGRRKRDRDAESGDVLKEKMGLEIDILEEHEDDARRAGLVEFGPDPSSGDHVVGFEAARKPLFEHKTGSNHKPSSNKITAAPTEALQHELSSNTRVVADPFSLDNTSNGMSFTNRSIPGLRPKRAKELLTSTIEAADNASEPVEEKSQSISQDSGHDAATTLPQLHGLLVNYDSE